MWTRKHLLKSLLALGLLPLSSFAQSKDEAQKEEVLPKKVDVIVIGSGAAGMSAAIAARDKGARTVVLEKMPIIGGNTLISSGVVNAPDEKNQKLQGIEDSNEWFYKQTLAAGHDKADPVLVKVLTDRSYQTIQWLESIGVKFKKGVFQVYWGGVMAQRALSFCVSRKRLRCSVVRTVPSKRYSDPHQCSGRRPDQRRIKSHRS